MAQAGTTRVLATSDLASVRNVLPALRQWLEHAHGRLGLRDGALGLVGVAISLAGLCLFDISPLVVLLHLLLALIFDGIGTRASMRFHETRTPRPFASPLRALAFVEAVIAALGDRQPGAGPPRIDAKLSPGGAGATATAPVDGNDAARLADGAAPASIPKMLLLFASVIALGSGALGVAAATIFDRRDWIVLAVLLVINVARSWSAWAGARATPGDAPWDRDWSLGAPGFGELMFWKHFRLMPLFLALILVLWLVAVLAAAQGDGSDHLAFAATLEARLRPLAVVLFGLAGPLQLMLLFAPRHARRKVARLDAFDLDDAQRRLQRVTAR